MDVEATGDGVAVEDLQDRSTVEGVVVVQSELREHRRPDVRVVGPHVAELAEVANAWPDEAEPRRRDLRLDVAVVPGEQRVDARQARGRREVGQEVVRIGEVGEHGVPVQVAGRVHVEELHLGLVGHGDH